MKKLCVFVFIFTTFFSMAHATLLKFEVKDAINRNAVCNDGSPAVYYVAPGSGDGIKRWVIALHGGGKGCMTPESYGNWPGSTTPYCWGTSIDQALFLTGTGILSGSSKDHPDFCNANRVFIPQCSFDFFAGNTKRTINSHDIQFRGRKIFTSVIKDLMSIVPGPTLSAQGTEVLLVGWGGNGGVGAMINLDWLAEQLPDAKVRGVNDAGWFIEELGWEEMKDVVEDALILWKAKLDTSCKRANRNNKSKCYTSSAFQYLETPLFVQLSQADHHLEQSKRTEKIIRDSLIPLDGAFSPKTSTSRISDRPEFTSIKVRGYSMADVLGNWFFDRSGPKKIIDK